MREIRRERGKRTGRQKGGRVAAKLDWSDAVWLPNNEKKKETEGAMLETLAATLMFAGISGLAVIAWRLPAVFRMLFPWLMAATFAAVVATAAWDAATAHMLIEIFASSDLPLDAIDKIAAARETVSLGALPAMICTASGLYLVTLRYLYAIVDAAHGR